MRARPDAGALTQLTVGLVLFGISLALLVRADLGLAPWDVFHQGVAGRTGYSLGTLVIATSVAVLVLWIPLRQRPGIGTLANALLVGLVVDAALLVLPVVDGTAARVALLVGGILLNAVAPGLYIGAGLGPGPRDGLMTGLASDRRSIRLVRTGIEVAVLAIGWLLGGSVGIGTALFALGIGPLTQPALHRFDRRRRAQATPPDGRTAPS